MVSRTTPSAGSSTRSSPGMRRARLLEHDEGVPLVDRLALLAEDLLDDALVLGLDRHLHLHGLEDRDGVALRDLVAHGTLDLPHRARDVGLDVRHSAVLRSSIRLVTGDPIPPLGRTGPRRSVPTGRLGKGPSRPTVLSAFRR